MDRKTLSEDAQSALVLIKACGGSIEDVWKILDGDEMSNAEVFEKACFELLTKGYLKMYLDASKSTN